MENSTNDKMLNELFGFGKKKTNAIDKMRNGEGPYAEAQYKPVSSKETITTNQLINKGADGSITVSDTPELQKRLTTALGMAMGSNSIKSMANRAIKSFPIIASDDLSADTLVMVKNMLEERYASYIDLLVSNQIINLTDYKIQNVDGDGNIAIQALDKISGTDFGAERIARQARTGSLSADDIAKNIPAWQLIRTNESYRSGNPLLDPLLENAIITTPDHIDEVAEGIFGTTLTEDAGDINRQDVYPDCVASTFSTNNNIVTRAGAAGYLIRVMPNARATTDVHEFWIDSYNGSGVIVATNLVHNRGNLVVQTNQTHVGIVNFDTGEITVDFTGIQGWTAPSAANPVNFVVHYLEKGTGGGGPNPDPTLGNWLNSMTDDTALKDRKKELQNQYNTSSMYVDKDNIKYDKMLSPKVVVDDQSLNRAIESSIGQILNDSKNPNSEYLKRRFQEASYLLISERISGNEYISYVSDRLGLPISKETRRDIITQFRASNVGFKGVSVWRLNGNGVAIDQQTREMQRRIAKNERVFNVKVAPKMLKLSAKDVFHIILMSLGGAGVGVGAGLAAAAVMSNPITLSVLAGAGVGAAGAALGTTIYKIIKKRNNQIEANNTIEGWERVESLIDEMEMTQSDAVKHAIEINGVNSADDKERISKLVEADKAGLQKFEDDMSKILQMSAANASTVRYESYNISDETQQKIYEQYVVPYTKQKLQRIVDFDDQLKEAVESDPELTKQLYESGLTVFMKTPGSLVVKEKQIKKRDIDAIVPAFGTRDVIAYGSVEYDRRDLKDRKFNEPLILTVTFKERYSDGKYSDSELTAVIGILGVITRVPSEEMAYILKSNSEGTTIDNLFKADDTSAEKDSVTKLIGNFMNSKYAEHLPTSGKIWNNLEKVGELAVANALAGNRNNGNVVNAHIIFSQKEIDQVKSDIGVDYLASKNIKLVSQLMKHYSASAIMVCNDALQTVNSYDDPDNISWDYAPYSAYLAKASDSQLTTAALSQIGRLR